MASKPTIELPDQWIERSNAWGRQVVADYAAGHNARSRAVGCFDADSNIALQQSAKMAECAFSLWLGADPERLHWARHCDGGSDITWGDKRWDVKTTRIGNKFLIWPITKNELFASKHFDALVLVKHSCPTFEISGWISKTAFAQQHRIAREGDKIFPGTRYVSDDQLWDVELIKAFLSAA